MKLMQEIGKLDIKIDVISNGLGKYIGFTVNRNLEFINSMQFMNSSLHALVKSLSDIDLKYLLQEFSRELLKLVKQKVMCIRMNI